MAQLKEYKCISCGAIKESEKDCTCSRCGYKMYPVPYDRKQVLTDEINRFFRRLTAVKIQPEEVIFYREEHKPEEASTENPKSKPVKISREEDDQRFPDFSTIQRYVCSAAKTEVFFARLDKSLEEIGTHIRENYQRQYTADFNTVRDRIKVRDEVLCKALQKLGITADIPQTVYPELRLDYHETPDDTLIDAADTILNLLGQLSAKIRRFIKVNNIYGAVYRKSITPSSKKTEERTDAQVLADIAEDIAGVLGKKYDVDIFSDGSDELSEMLQCVWTAIYAVMTLPVVRKTAVYTFGNGTVVSGNSFVKSLEKEISARYSGIPAPAADKTFTAAKTEEEMFELYNTIIELDILGVMGINAAGLVKIGDSEKKLNQLIGLSGIKDSIKKIKAYALANKGSDAINIHMCFYGNPGTGKTEVARIIAGILYESGILPSKNVVEVDRGGLVSQFVGETPQKTMEAIRRAMGGVLFIDEAYALVPKDGGSWDFGQEAVAALIKAMEDYRGKFCVILAGYKTQMAEMIASNPGFKSRIQFELDFPNYDRDELGQITRFMLQKRRYTVTDEAMRKILDITDVKRKEPNFANAREIRNILDQVIMCQNVRTGGAEDHELGLVDVNRYIRDAKIRLPVSEDGKTVKILTGDEELEQLVGLASVKRMVRKIRAYARRNSGSGDFNLHMCFYGNPGTGKTEVARILSRILYDAGVLPEAKLVETDSTGLLGKVIGETGPKTKEKIGEAMGGILFIDEAYQLTGGSSGGSSGYGEEAIAVLLKEMEDRRGQFGVILAGYKQEMKAMLAANPGFESRIQFTLDFPDYTREELGEIARAFLRKKKYEIEPSALNRLLDVAEYYRNRPNFANARTVRNILDQVIMNQNLRAEEDEDDYMIILDDVEDYITDENINMSEAENKPRTIGFSL